MLFLLLLPIGTNILIPSSWQLTKFVVIRTFYVKITFPNPPVTRGINSPETVVPMLAGRFMNAATLSLVLRVIALALLPVPRKTAMIILLQVTPALLSVANAPKRLVLPDPHPQPVTAAIPLSSTAIMPGLLLVTAVLPTPAPDTAPRKKEVVGIALTPVYRALLPSINAWQSLAVKVLLRLTATVSITTPSTLHLIPATAYAKNVL